MVESGQPATRALLTATQLCKRYGRTTALVDGSLSLVGGRVTGVVGENGSGKSTLVKLLSGITRPDEGRIQIGGEVFPGFQSPSHAKRLGIAAVLQETLVAPARSVVQNVYIGSDRWFRSGRSQDDRRRRASDLLGKLTGEELDLDMPVECLPISRQQIVTIARALMQDPRILILDEATSALDVADRDRILAVCRDLCEDGVALLLITHRLEELLALADSIVVMRDGATVTSEGDLEAKVSRESLLEAMTGGQVAGGRVRAPNAGERPDAKVVLRANGVDIGGGPIDWELESGAIIGLAGLEGHGQERFLRVLAGIEPPSAGHVTRIGGAGSIAIRSQQSAARQRIAYLPRSRSRDGIFPSLSVLDNFALPTLGRSTVLGIIRLGALRERFIDAQRSLRIHAASMHAPVTTLSGGNQQKVLLARWLAAEPEILMLDDPTRGVDVPTKVELHRLLRERAEHGTAVVIVSTELEELEELCDSVLVFHDNRVSARLCTDRVTATEILAAMFESRS
jgi:ABC-type sugar transport system ATPase subunit